MKKNIKELAYNKKRKGSILLEAVIAISIMGFLSFYVNDFLYKNKQELLLNSKKENLYFTYYLVIDNIDMSGKNEIKEKQLSEFINYDIITKEDSVKIESNSFDFKRERIKTIYLYDNIPVSVYLDTLKIDNNYVKIQRYFTLK